MEASKKRREESAKQPGHITYSACLYKGQKVQSITEANQYKQKGNSRIAPNRITCSASSAYILINLKLPVTTKREYYFL
jgi:hypothetical protein